MPRAKDEKSSAKTRSPAPPPPKQQYGNTLGPEPAFTVEQVADALRKGKGIKSEAARILKCSRQTVVNYCARHPELEVAISEARETMGDLAETKLGEALKAGKDWALKFYLETIHKRRGYTKQYNLAGVDGGPAIKVETTHKLGEMSSEDLRALQEVLRRAQDKEA